MNSIRLEDIRGAVLILACCLVFPADRTAAHPAKFTIEQIMEAPFPSDLLASPTGKSVAWVFDSKGCRNVWVADGPGMQSRQLTSFTQDEGFAIGDLSWSPDARMIAFTRAADLETEKPANISSSPAGPAPREVWVVPTSGGPARKVGVGHDPMFSPDGSSLLLIDKGQILSASVNADSAPKALIIDQGKVHSMAWSPDGKHLGFISERDDHSLIGVYDVAARTIVWMSPSLDHDQSFVFSPSGSQVAFVRVPAEKLPEFVSRRSGQPWSIWVANIAGGEGQRVWSADDGAGSVFYPTLSEANLLWTARGELVFPWEKTGWAQLYAVPVQGGTPRAVTSGKFEVMHMALSSDRRHLVFSSNQDDGDRMHIWKVDFDHGGPVRVTADHDIEDYPQVNDAGTVFALQSGATKSLQPVMLAGGQWKLLAPQSVPAGFPSSKLVTPEVVTFAAKDGQLVHAQIFLPHETSGTKSHPAVLFFHGGPRRQMVLGFHPMDAYNWMYALNQYFASQGYLVLSVNYRGGIGYGMEYREANDFGPDGGSELNDLLGAIDYLHTRKEVDPRKVGIWGGSYGGLMTALGLARASDSIAAGVDYAGVYNWATLLPARGGTVDPGQATKRAVASSPIATIDQWKSPVLIVQADDDRAVPSHQATELIEDLRSHHVVHETIIIPNEIHDLIRYSSWMRLFNAADEYFDRQLEKRPPAP
ncbi:MAG TPA: prolyl oligopeptidase family serine peptidase [Steroidobacteraceae bacterium]|jgi:dipeptidyl aminopeptidase/acylaminoacyl peptidase